MPDQQLTHFRPSLLLPRTCAIMTPVSPHPQSVLPVSLFSGTRAHLLKSHTDAPLTLSHKRPRVNESTSFIASPQLSSGSSSGPTSSPLINYSSPASSASACSSASPLSRFTINRNAAHIPNAKRAMALKIRPAPVPFNYNVPSTSYRYRNSPLLQRVHQALTRLHAGTCTLCWVAGDPNPGSHLYASCPRAHDDHSELQIAFKSFKSGFDVPTGTCYGCFMKPVCHSQSCSAPLTIRYRG